MSSPTHAISTRAFLVCAGTSPKGMQFTIDHMDAIFLGASDLNDLAKKSQMVKEMAVASGRKIKTYTMINLVIADTDEQAQAMVEHYREGFDEGAFRGVMRAYGVLDAEVGKENAFTRKARSGFIQRICGRLDGVRRCPPDEDPR